MSMMIDIGDGQTRKYYLTGLNLMSCFFYKDHKQTGWCLWARRNEIWHVEQTSRGEGRSRARIGFNDILDDVCASLVLEMELEL